MTALPPGWLPGFEPPPPPPPREPTERELFEIERLVEQAVQYIHLHQQPDFNPERPIGCDDIARCRRDIMKHLEVTRLPLPSEAWLDELLIELAAWWFEFPIAADVPPPQIEVAPDGPPRAAPPLPDDGVIVGWDPWADP
jgi:hypothetical protein